MSIDRNIDKRANGYRVRMAVPGRGVVTVGTYRTLAQARSERDKQRAAMGTGTFVDPERGRITFKDWADLWLAGKSVRPNTAGGYRFDLDHDLIPAFGHLQLRFITHDVVLAWIVATQAAGTSPALVNRLHGLLSRVLVAAVKGGRLAVNPCANTRSELPRADVPEFNILTRPEAEKLMLELPTDRDRLIALLGLYAGLRWSEIYGLRTDCITATELRVNSVRILVNNRYEEHPPKTKKSRRKVPLARQLREPLATHVAGLEHGQLVFTDKDVRYSTWYRKVWLPAVDRAGLSLRFHDLRHTCASWLLEAGVDLVTVMQIMGHSQLATTQRYLHTNEQRKQSAIDLLSNLE